MQVISKQTLIFRVQGKKDFVLHPTNHPVSASEHIRDTHLFKLAASDGTVQEFVPVPVAPVAPSDDEKAKADADKAAADAKAKADADAKDKKAK